MKRSGSRPASGSAGKLESKAGHALVPSKRSKQTNRHHPVLVPPEKLQVFMVRFIVAIFFKP